MSTRVVDVDLPGRAYEVRIGRGVLGEVPELARRLLGQKAERVLVVRDTGVPQRFVDELVRGLRDSGFGARVCDLTPSEAVKRVETAERLLIEAVRFGLTRVDAVISLGGGVVCDIAGYVAASYQRGIAVVQCPSTLLSMVDASVGGKTGVNLLVDGELYKNMVGAFHQPTMVVADTALLDSLDARQRRCGLAECVKHAMICQSVPDEDETHAELLGWMQDRLGAISAFDREAIDELVERNVALKASVVAGDERESPEARTGGRMLLNFGHTFGHAIETLDGLRAGDEAGLFHGEAVGLGMCCACAAAVSLGMCDDSVGSSLRAMLDAVGLPTLVEGLPGAEEIVERMGHDKKAAGGSLRVILPEGLGRCSIVTDADIGAIGAGVGVIRAD
ncbi:MAG: 3-dehydroquinate synthase family protein [Phycisphaerales bacterium JB052]